MTQTYNADAIEVLTGLEPVRRRPGMYTDTTRPNHLGQEVIDNSVDEALAGHAKRVDVILHADQSLEVIDDGRGMPVDIHPEEGVPAVELILCRLHAGGKFSNKNYQFSGGLHGVGISVVNALSKRVEVNVVATVRFTTSRLKTAIRCRICRLSARAANATPAPASTSGLTKASSTARVFRFSPDAPAESQSGAVPRRGNYLYRPR